MSTRATFPLLDQGRTLRESRMEPIPSGVPWAFIAPHEAQARTNHDQSLARLAERGGLSPQEMLAVVEDRKWRWGKDGEPSIPAALHVLGRMLAAAGMEFVP